MVGIVSRAPAVDEKVCFFLLVFCFLPAGLWVAQPCRYCFTQWSKNGLYAPQGRHVAPINVKFGMGDAPPCQISCLLGQKYGNTAPKTVKISNFGHKFVPQGRLFALFWRNLLCLYASIASFYVFSLVALEGQTTKLSAFSRGGVIFPQIFNSPYSLAAKLLIGSKKLWGCKNRTDILYHHAKYDGGRGSRAGCRPKSVIFFYLSRFRMTKFVITETHCNCQNNYGVIA